MEMKEVWKDSVTAPSGTDPTLTMFGGIASNDVVIATGFWSGIREPQGMATSDYGEVDRHTDESGAHATYRKVMAATPDSWVTLKGNPKAGESATLEIVVKRP